MGKNKPAQQESVTDEAVVTLPEPSEPEPLTLTPKPKVRFVHTIVAGVPNGTKDFDDRRFEMEKLEDGCIRVRERLQTAKTYRIGPMNVAYLMLESDNPEE